ncbi:MAG: hypothetical protein KJO79_01645 [Verrucomicrobiae bacterium]|nr:hypothetical protein [Verrucomicrobiae bacterium]NNJ85851.1 hypothetical protein [Akkermansiaceae bacterium]
MKKLVLFALLMLSPGVTHAQVEHFPNQKWRETKTDHFTIRTQGASAAGAKRLAEKVWEICERTMPGIKEEYANNTFQTPTGASGSDDKPYRFTIYIVKRIYPYQEMVEKVAQDMGDRAAGYKRLCMETKTFSDRQHRYAVFCLEDRQGDIEALLAHSVASSMLAGHGRMKGRNFFHTAGYGYYVEHLLFKKCRIHYLDFSRYYEDVEMVRGEVLDAKSPWTRPLKKMVRKGDVKPRLRDLVGTDVAELNPPRSGLLFALAHYMCHEPENTKKHHAYMNKLRAGASVSMELILESYGFENEKAFNTAFTGYILSRKFR